MENKPQRVLSFESIANFRDLGGYQSRGGRITAWRRLYRSGGLLHMTEKDKAFLKNDIQLKTVVDLRSPEEPKKLQEIRLLEEIGAKYFNVQFKWPVADYYKKEMDLYASTSNMGVVYLHRIRHEGFAKRLFSILEILADPQYYPLLFHCGAGKDRTGVLAAMLLNLLGVSDEDVISDYVLTDPSMEDVKQRICSDPETSDDVRNLPDFTWRAPPQFMETFLKGLKEEYGSAAGYLRKYGADKTLVRRLEKALLV
jgi:protein-tyrosine phosphatase